MGAGLEHREGRLLQDGASRSPRAGLLDCRWVQNRCRPDRYLTRFVRRPPSEPSWRESWRIINKSRTRAIELRDGLLRAPWAEV